MVKTIFSPPIFTEKGGGTEASSAADRDSLGRYCGYCGSQAGDDVGAE